MARTKLRHIYLPYTFPAVAGTHLPTRKRWRVWVSPGRGCKEQLAHGCYATAHSQWDSNPWPRGRWSNMLTTRLSHYPVVSQVNVVMASQSHWQTWSCYEHSVVQQWYQRSTTCESHQHTELSTKSPATHFTLLNISAIWHQAVFHQMIVFTVDN